MRRVWKWLRESGWKWLRENVFKAIVLAALTASVTAWLRGTFDTILRESLPSGAEISCVGREWIIDHSPFRQLEPSKEVFRILVATLDHDDANRTLTEAVVRAFQGEKGIEAIETCRVLKIEGGGERIAEVAAKRGQGWLSRRDADVLVFGEWIEKGEALNLHFLPVGGGGDFRQHAFKLETGLLKGDFSEAMGAQIQAVALATVKPATEESGKYLVETLRPVAVRLEQLIHFPPSGLSAGQLADVQFALGLALNIIGEQAGDNKALTEAVAAFRAALEERTRARVPLDWCPRRAPHPHRSSAVGRDQGCRRGGADPGGQAGLSRRRCGARPSLRRRGASALFVRPRVEGAQGQARKVSRRHPRRTVSGGGLIAHLPELPGLLHLRADDRRPIAKKVRLTLPVGQARSD